MTIKQAERLFKPLPTKPKLKKKKCKDCHKVKIVNTNNICLACDILREFL